MGRTDDMMKIKGVNVFPSQIEEVLKEFPELSSEYQIRISHLDGKDTYPALFLSVNQELQIKFCFYKIFNDIGGLFEAQDG